MATVIFPRTPTTTRTSRFATSRHHSCGSPSPPILFLNHRAISLPSIRRSRLFHPPSAVSCERSDNGNLWRVEDDELGFTDKWKTRIELLKSVLPGGSWWRLEDVVGTVGEGGGKDSGRDVTLAFALKRMWKLVGHDRWIVFCGFAALVFAVMSDMSIPNFLAASIFSAQNGNAVQFHRNAQLLVFLCISSGICSGLRSCCFGIANMILVKRMREKLYSSLLFQDISFFDSKTVGELTSRLGSDCQQVSRVIGNDLNLISRDTLQVIGALVFLFSLSWRLALSTLAICCTLSAIMVFHGRFQKKAAKSIQDCTAKANEVSQETLSLLRTVRVYGTEKQELARYLKWLKKLADISFRQSFAYGFWSLSLSFFYHSTQVVAVLVGGASVMAGHISAEQLTKFILYSEWLIYSTWRLADNWSSLLQSIGASEKVFQMMDLLPSTQFVRRGLELENLTGHVEFIDVSFSYPSRESILVDGFYLEKMNMKWLRERIGYVGQEPRLFHMDVSSNIQYGCTREVNQEDVEWAAKQAFAHEFITSLPKGYHTLVDDALLSGGQKQRIAIARAILRDPSILILDEATSALDAESEHYVKGVMRAVQTESKTRRTVVVIAHRLSTIRAADRIIVMDNGRIVEVGNHVDLLSKDGIYAKLTKRQADAFA